MCGFGDDGVRMGGGPVSVVGPSAPGSPGIDGDAELLQELGLVCQGDAGKLVVVGQPVGEGTAGIVAVAGGLLRLGLLSLLRLVQRLELLEGALGLGHRLGGDPALGQRRLQCLVVGNGVVEAPRLLDVGGKGVGAVAGDAEAGLCAVVHEQAGDLDVRHVRLAVKRVPGVVEGIGGALLLAVLGLAGLHRRGVGVVERLPFLQGGLVVAHLGHGLLDGRLGGVFEGQGAGGQQFVVGQLVEGHVAIYGHAERDAGRTRGRPRRAKGRTWRCAVGPAWAVASECL